MKRYIKSDINIRDFENAVERHYDRLFDEYNKEPKYTEEKDTVWVQFWFDNTVIPIEDGNVTEEGWNILAKSCNTDDLENGDVGVYLSERYHPDTTIDADDVLECLRVFLIDSIPDLPSKGICSVRVNGYINMDFPVEYEEWQNEYDEKEYSYIHVGLRPKCELENFSYQIL